MEILIWALWELRFALQQFRRHKNSDKIVDFKSAISPTSELRFDPFFFEIGWFFERISDLQLDFAYLAPGRLDLRRKLAALKNYLQPHWFLNQRYLLHPDSDLTDFFFEIGYFSHRIQICNYILQILHQIVQILSKNSPPPKSYKKKKSPLVCPRKCYDTTCYRSNPEIL